MQFDVIQIRVTLTRLALTKTSLSYYRIDEINSEHENEVLSCVSSQFNFFIIFFLSVVFVSHCNGMVLFSVLICSKKKMMTRWKAINTTQQNVLILIREGDDITLLQLLCSSHSYLAHTEEVNTGAMEWEFVPVPIDLKAHVIGRRHSVINEMMAISGATIEPGSRHHAGFIVSGHPQEIEMAKQFISEKLVSFKFGNFKINVILYCGR